MNAPLKETVYIKPPKGVTSAPGRVWLLQKSLYGLQQSAQDWGETLYEKLHLKDFIQSEADPALYVNRSKGEYIRVHIDDILYIRPVKEQFGSWLKTHFVTKDLGRPRYLLSIEITWDESRRVYLRQTDYIKWIVNQFLPGLLRPSLTPLSCLE